MSDATIDKKNNKTKKQMRLTSVFFFCCSDLTSVL